MMTGATPPAVPISLLHGLLDDAAVFPPGNASLPDAVAGHRIHRAAWYSNLVGPLVLPTSALADLSALLRPEDVLPLAMTLSEGPDGLSAVLDAVADLPVALVAVEVAVPVGVTAADLVAQLDRTDTRVDIIVEIPRDERRNELLAAIAGRYRAKLRTGGIRPDLYPDEAELAATVAAAAGAGVPFKATAGLHHAIRNTDPHTGFEQHGFLNLVLATAAAQETADPSHTHDIRSALAERDGTVVAARIRQLGTDRLASARSLFTSFGTCSITEPLDEMVALGVLASPAESEEGDHP